MGSNGNGFHFQASPPNAPEDLLAGGGGMEVDSDSVDSGNGRRGDDEEGSLALEDKAHEDGDDGVDIVIPPSTPSLRSASGTPQDGNGDRMGGGSESDSRSWYSIFKRLVPAGSGDLIQEAACAANDLMYNMDHPNRGKCVIFNHCKFDKCQQLPERTGSDHDVQKITSTFSKLGFIVQEYRDCKFDAILTTLTSIAKEDHSQNDCLAVFVLSHGQANELHAFDMTYKPSTLWDMFTANKCSTLAGKPKMFFIQACRGFQYDDGTDLQVKFSRTEVDGPGDQTYRIPNQADFLTVFSTYDASNGNRATLKRTMQYLSLGYFSWRNSKSGSCFIQALCTVLSEMCQYKDVLSMLTLVNREVSIKYESRSKESTQNKKKQVPHVCHTLMRDIYLLPKHRSTLV